MSSKTIAALSAVTALAVELEDTQDKLASVVAVGVAEQKNRKDLERLLLEKRNTIGAQREHIESLRKEIAVLNDRLYGRFSIPYGVFVESSPVAMGVKTLTIVPQRMTYSFSSMGYEMDVFDRKRIAEHMSSKIEKMIFDALLKAA